MTTLVLPDGEYDVLSKTKMAEALRLPLLQIERLAPGMNPVPVAHIVDQGKYHGGATEDGLLHAMATTLQGITGFLSSDSIARIFGDFCRRIEIPRVEFESLIPNYRLRYLRYEITQLLAPLAEAAGESAHNLVRQLVSQKRQLLNGMGLQQIYHIKGGMDFAPQLDAQGVTYIRIAYRSQELHALLALNPL